MFFILTSIDERGAFEDFPFWVDKLEDGLEIVNGIAASGHVLVKVCYADKHRMNRLPVSIFDGTPFAEPMQRLETEWRTILASPPKSLPTASDNRVAVFLQQKIKRYEQQIQQLETKVTILRAKLEKVCDYRGNRVLKPALIQHFQLLITTCEQHCIRLHSLKDQSVDLLSKLYSPSR